ncbi:polysaccharide biosynthesis tyrosine autokinase [Dyella flava]|uniref:non-specific protein-tyrosine kinase n=1 Tax=Dyella flava TaxID=1920170 RepID=A0ABS2K0L0_9GAMM|nr:polysaccharide biosynthesis tyrosine autokinase [Dyella flava]MBM7124773.1 polysaccharide biosynthesis tyrosine autokinase [Dyella flava]GLQ50818.1 tyrosine-protein kinase involved in EPS biosynthesis [Dyella flava]
MKTHARAAGDASFGSINLFAVLDMLWRSRALVVKTVGSIFALGVLYAWLATPIYESSLLVQIEDNSDSASTQLLGDLSSFLGAKSSDQAEMQILGSRDVLGSAVDRTRYYIQAEPARFPLIGRWIADGSRSLSQPGLLGYGGYAWGNESIDVARFDMPDVFYDDTFTLITLGGGRYSLRSPHMPKAYIGQIGDTAQIQTDAGDVVLNVKAINANPGTRFRLYRHSRQLTISELQQRITIVDKAKDAGVISVALQSSRPQQVTALVKAVGDAYVLQNSEQKSLQAEKSLTFLEQQLPGMKQDLRHAENALLAYRNSHGVIDLSEEAKLQLGEVVDRQTRVSLLQQERQAKQLQFMPAHPDMLAIDAQIALLKQQIQGIDAQLKHLPNTEQDVVRLTREVKVNNDLYVAMLNSVQQLRLLRAGKVGNVRIVDHAEVPEQPVKPRRALVIGGSLLLGLLAGIGAALMRDLWRGSVTDPQEIEHALGAVVLATIPLSKGQLRRERLRLRAGAVNRLPVAISQPKEPAVEGMRSLSVAVQLLGLDARNNIVLITSPTQGVGKSFITANLGVLLAKAGKRVLLVDADLRKGVLHRSFQLDEGPGLSSVLRAEVTFADAVQPTSQPGLSVLTSGARRANSTELLQTAALDKCLADAAANYDIVLLDSAPVLPVADTLWLAQSAGTVYVAARYGLTSEGELIATRARLARAGVDIQGVVLNGVQASLQGARYGQYGYGTYGDDLAGNDMEGNGAPT